MKTRRLLVLVAGFYVGLVGLLAILHSLSRSGPQSWPQPHPSWNPPPSVDPKVVALIDRLIEVADEGPGTHSTAWASGFMAVDEDFRFRGGILGSKKPVVHPAMRDLVRMGVAALPDLLRHLSDPRETRLVLQHKEPFGAAWHSDEYDPRYADAGRQPQGVNTGREGEFTEYTLRVGDLCYVAVGQIVNRNLAAVRYQPSMCLVVNSPVQTPVLAAAARQDWSGLTPEEHQQSLIADALADGAYAAPEALVRLYFYYPAAAEPLALKLLGRPWYDSEKVREFITGRLVESKTPQQWKRAIAGFTAANRQTAAAVIPAWLHEHYARSSSEEDKHFREQQVTAKKILACLYPDYNPDHPPFLNAATETEQTSLVAGLSGIRSKMLDESVGLLFRSLDLERFHGLGRLYPDDLALACMDRLLGKGMDNAFKAYCERRIRELGGKHREAAEEQRLEFLRERLQRIRPAAGAEAIR
jgi:hypothetical protein